MFRIRCACLVLLCCLWFRGQAQFQLSDHARISVITCGPWQGELYTAFGHCAMRVFDPANHIDYAYNYGVFDFNQPHFYLNFARGYLNYQLGVYSYPDFLNFYIGNNQSVHEQVLNLNAGQRQKIFDYLQWNSLPANEHYMYDYYYDNCATRIRDVVLTALKGEVSFDLSFIQTHYSLRELTHQYLHHQPWGELGIDLCLGDEIDKPMPAFNYMFLPDYIEQSFDHAKIKTENGDYAPIVLGKRIAYEALPQQYAFEWYQPLMIFSAFFLIILAVTYRDFRLGKISLWVDYPLLVLTGLLGLLMILLWTATDHKSAMNFNLLWAVPLNLVAIFGLAFRARWIQAYFRVIAVIVVFTLIAWPILPQQLNTSLIPLLLSLGLRWGMHGWRNQSIARSART